MLCIAVTALVLKFTALGTYVQAVGINKEAARISGYKSAAIIFICYVVCGLFAGIAGITATSRIYFADTNNIGLNLEMDAILAVALGGNSLGGGKFRLCPAPSSAPTPFRPSPPRSTRWACPRRRPRCSRPSS